MKKVLKAVALVLCAAMLALSVASCGTTENGAYRIGICQLVQHPALDEATKGFKEALTKLLGDKVTFDEQNASGEATNCSTIVNKFVSDNVDLIMANATDALAAAANATQTIPVVGTSITDYGVALDLKLNDGKTGINVTGTADLAPLDQQAQMITEFAPNAKTVGIIYCSSEKNSQFQVDEVTRHLEAKGITVKQYSFADTNDITTVATKAAQDCDVLYAPTDNTVANNVEAVNNIIEAAGKPLIAGEKGICEGCGIATLSISYYDIGYAAGEMAYDILVNGKDPAEMTIGYSDKFEKLYVKERCDKLGIKVPEGYAVIE